MSRLIALVLTFLLGACGSSPKHDTLKLLIAAESGDVRGVKEQLDNGAGPDDIQNIGDRTALCLAALNAEVETVRILLEAGADPKAEHSGGNIKLDVQGFRGLLKGAHADPDSKRTYKKQDGTTVELRKMSLHDAEYDRILKMLDDASARVPK